MSRLEVATDLVARTISVTFKPNKKTASIELHDNNWTIDNLTKFRLYDFIGVINELTDKLCVGFQGGKFSKLKVAHKAQVWLKGKIIRMVAVVVSKELHKLLPLADVQALAFDKAIFKCYGKKLTYGTLESFFNDTAFMSSQLCKDIIQYRVACMAFVDACIMDHSKSTPYDKLDWKRYYCHKNKLNKHYINTFKSINYQIAPYLLQELKKIKLERTCNTRAELLIYLSALKSLEYGLNYDKLNKFWNIILSVQEKEIKDTVKNAKKLGFYFNLRKNGYHELVSHLLESKLHYKSFRECIMEKLCLDTERRKASLQYPLNFKLSQVILPSNLSSVKYLSDLVTLFNKYNAGAIKFEPSAIYFEDGSRLCSIKNGYFGYIGSAIKKEKISYSALEKLLKKERLIK